MPDAWFSDVARRYGIAERVLFRYEPGSRAGVRRCADHRCERAF